MRGLTNDISYQVRVIVHDIEKGQAPTNEEIEVSVHRAVETRLAGIHHNDIRVTSERLDK